MVPLWISTCYLQDWIISNSLIRSLERMDLNNDFTKKFNARTIKWNVKILAQVGEAYNVITVERRNKNVQQVYNLETTNR